MEEHGCPRVVPGLQPCPRDRQLHWHGDHWQQVEGSDPSSCSTANTRPLSLRRANAFLLGYPGPPPSPARVGRGVCRGESSALQEQELCKCSLSMCEMEAPNWTEPACMLCGQTDADPDICGLKHLDSGICAHAFCMAFSNGLLQQATRVNTTAEVSPVYVQRVIQEAEQKHCFVCGETGAPITCAETGCELSFHLPCARVGECVTQYYGNYSSFCQKHSPEQAAEATPEQSTNCIICMEPVEDNKSYSTLVCPACKHAWFHRACIQVGALPYTSGQAAAGNPQHLSLLPLLLMTVFLLQGQAIRAGINCFQCPLCRDADAFLSDMLIMGIRIPLSGPMWEDGNAYASLGVRHGRCDATECLCPQGREQAEGEGPWEMLLCSSCAAEGTHRCCSQLSNNADEWECQACAGVGTASTVNSEVTGPSTASQQGLLPSNSSTASESSSSSTASQAASGPGHSSQVPDSGSQSSQPGTGQSHAAAPSGAAERCTPTSAGQRPPRSSRASRAAGSRRSGQGERNRTRSRSPIQSQAPRSSSHPQRRSGRSHAPAPMAESGSPRYTRRGALGSSGDAPAADGRSQPMQLVQAQTRSRSPVERRPAQSRGQLQRRLRGQSRRRRPAQVQSRSRVHRATNPRSRPQRGRRTSRV
ncbi:uncharacterized protein LOC122159350 [Centrocercus urophasianus]|uniref:uncharacterized protein LOC122159350 n=1 Tax=Centrocercus urophasianus TaxID=9002 RepID=UPI001C646864|nr:uncharacterized protein LOC122159350 [Centrocercus urophasianus]